MLKPLDESGAVETEGEETETTSAGDQSSDASEGSESTIEEEVDWKAKYEESEIALKQERNVSRSREGQRNRNQDIESRQKGLEDSIKGQGLSISRILDILSEDKPELKKAINQERQEVATSRQAADSKTRQNTLMDEILNLVQEYDDEGNATVLITEDEQRDLNRLWGEALEEAKRMGNDAPLYAVKMKAQSLNFAVERRALEDAVAAERENAKTKTAKALEEHGVQDQDTGPARAGAGGAERKRGSDLIQEALNEGSSLFPRSK